MSLDLFSLFCTFSKLGFLSFGGGYAMLSMVMSEAQRFSVSPAQFADLNALDMVVPGPIAVNAATYVGYRYLGLFGAFAATAGVSLPSFVLTVIITRLFTRFKDNDWLNDILSGIKPAAVGLIATAAITIAYEVLRSPLGALSPVCVAVFISTAVLNIRFKVNPILLTVLAGIGGAIMMP